jgi:photosystem II stability/assembly factor-like uncharacterized protein
MIKIFLFIFFFTGTATSQYLWKISHTDYDERYYYCIDALSCDGDNCMACGRKVDSVAEESSTVFWQSKDGGKTWIMQNSGLPGSPSATSLTSVNFIQHIDPLNVISAGTRRYYKAAGELPDSIQFLHTSDGGSTWGLENIHVNGVPRSINFYDSLTGMMIVQEDLLYGQGTVFYGEGSYKALTTSDGGCHWNSINVKLTSGGPKCFAFGKSSFKILTSWHGPILSTEDNWKTIDTSGLLIKNDRSNNFRIINCNFIGSDTVIAYGYNVFDTSKRGDPRNRAIIARSFDGGKTWGEPQVFAQGSIFEITTMTKLHHDTLLAGGISTNKLLMSTDRGMTWREDSLNIIDTTYLAAGTYHMEFTGTGNPLAIYTYMNNYGVESVPSIIIRGELPKAGVEWDHLISYTDRIFPNPATTTLNIANLEEPKPFWILDILGRNVLSGMLLDHSAQIVNISSLSSGIYYVLSLGVYNNKMIIGKLVVTGK